MHYLEPKAIIYVHICGGVKKTGIHFHLFLLSDFQAAADEITNKGEQCVNQQDSSSQKITNISYTIFRQPAILNYVLLYAVVYCKY